jgi:glycine hydroxymethyltransferase
VDTPANPAGGLRIGLNEAVRWGLTTADMPELADLVARGLGDGGAEVAPAVTAFRSRFRDLHFMSN